MSLSPILGMASQVLNLFGGGSSKSASASSSVDFSQAAQLVSKLKDLSQADSAKFKQLTAQISTQLQQDAEAASGSGQTFLSHLADQFSAASQPGGASRKPASL